MSEKPSVPDPISEYFRALGKKGGLARAKNLSAARLREIGKMGWAARRKMLLREEKK